MIKLKLIDKHLLSYNLITTDGGGIYNQSPQQYATGNWWGAASGPNTPGADTVGGNVDTSSYLTKPILGCGVPGDVNGDGDVDMEDVILSLQVCIGKQSVTEDVNGDDKIGIEEAIYVLREVAEL